MRKRKTYSVIFSFLIVILTTGLFAQTVNVVTKEGKEQIITYTGRTLSNTGVTLNSGDFIGYNEISYIGTDHFDAYENAMKKASKKNNQHLKVAFTGDQNLYALQLEKLEKKRTAANAARGAGGLLMIIGAISGDEDIYTIGAASYVTGTVARDINTESTISAQNDAIVALQDEQNNKTEAEAQIDEYLRAYGRENVEGVIALLKMDHERALALANVGETSKDANHRVAAVWLKAIIYADQGNEKALEKEYDRLVILDPEVESIENARNWMEVLIKDLNELRNS